MKILITENDPVRQRQLRTILTSLGHKSANIETAFDTKSTLSAARKKKFDVVFLCHENGGINGLDLVKELKESSSKQTPVILFSPNLSKEVLLQGHQIGANGFLSYPFSVNDVESSILMAIKNAR
jgi:DNA-binding response OmpR family regulator